MSAAEWLVARLPAAPEALMTHMLAALPEDGESIPDALAQGALALYAQLLGAGQGREAALPLLAADALLTHAFEAQAEMDPAGIPALAERWGASGSLGELAQTAS